jgi:hypothetical protein
MTENTSGQGNNAVVPAEVDRWNWGAFLLSWIWGIGNNTFIALLMFVPFVNMVMTFVLGAKGSAWAWRNKKWESVEQFKRVQREWAKWGLIVFAAFVVFIAALYIFVGALFKNSEAVELAIAKLQANPEAMQILGKPVSIGIPMGSMEFEGSRGHANLEIGVSGPDGKGAIFMEATRELGQWKADRIVFEQDGTKRRIDLNQ